MKALWYTLISLPRLLWALIWSQILYCKRNKVSHNYKYQKIQKLVRKELKVMKVVYHVDGKENIPIEESYLITPNHQSALDCLAFFDIWNDQVGFVAKDSSSKYPIINNILGVNDSLYLNRSDLRQEIRVMKKVRDNMLNMNVRYVIFPEGTRTKNKDLSMNDFHAGTFKYTMSIKKKIVPVAIYGNTFVLDDKIKMKEYPVFVSILPPLSYEDYKNMTTQEVATKVHDLIQTRVKELALKYSEYLKK
jgi:1-acyl-sn-glycerol-3-phosphate acyltransferase